MKFKSIHIYQILVFLSGFLSCLIGITLEDYNHGYTVSESLSEWHHYIAPVIMGAGMSLIGHFFWIRRKHRLEAIAKLEENENKYRTLYENMQDAVCILDNDKCILDANQASADLFAYSKSELIGMSINQFLYEEDKDVSNAYFQDLEEEGSYSMYEGRILTRNKEIKWIQVNSSEFIADGKKIGSQDIIRDITSRKQIELELQNTIKQLNELIFTKDKLFSIIAHDLRSPFNSILGLSQLLMEHLADVVNEKQASALKTINTTAHSTLYLLENLLNWAKSQTGKINYTPAPLELKNLVGEIVTIANPSLLIKEIQLGLDIGDQIEIVADENMIRSVISNLISNAIKYTETGGTIEVSAVMIDNLIEVAVNDNGIGIAKEQQEKLFNIESNASSLGTSNEKGSGLGLVLCKDFIEKHSGRIWVESDGKNGSSFKFTLPLKQ